LLDVMTSLHNGDEGAASKDVQRKFHNTSVNDPVIVAALGCKPGHFPYLADDLPEATEERLKDVIRELINPRQSLGAFTSGGYRTTVLRCATAAVRL
jgi:hypothetical protein